MAGGPFVKAGLSVGKARKLFSGLQRVKQQKRQALTDYKRGVAEKKAGEVAGPKLMLKSEKKFNRLSIDQKKIEDQLDGFQPELFD